MVAAVFLVILVIGLIGFVPFETVSTPRWRIQVVDSKGFPAENRRVVQFCENYTLSVDPCSEASDRVLVTDKNGIVEFSERHVRMSLWSRVFYSVVNALLIFAHGSYGTDAYVLTTGNAELKFDPNKPQPHILVLRETPQTQP